MVSTPTSTRKVGVLRDLVAIPTWHPPKLTMISVEGSYSDSGTTISIDSDICAVVVVFMLRSCLAYWYDIYIKGKVPRG